MFARFDRGKNFAVAGPGRGGEAGGAGQALAVMLLAGGRVEAADDAGFLSRTDTGSRLRPPAKRQCDRENPRSRQQSRWLCLPRRASEISPAAPGLIAATMPRWPVSRSPEST